MNYVRKLRILQNSIRFINVAILIYLFMFTKEVDFVPYRHLSGSPFTLYLIICFIIGIPVQLFIVKLLKDIKKEDYYSGWIYIFWFFIVLGTWYLFVGNTIYIIKAVYCYINALFSYSLYKPFFEFRNTKE